MRDMTISLGPLQPNVSPERCRRILHWQAGRGERLLDSLVYSFLRTVNSAGHPSPNPFFRQRKTGSNSPIILRPKRSREAHHNAEDLHLDPVSDCDSKRTAEIRRGAKHAVRATQSLRVASNRATLKERKSAD